MSAELPYVTVHIESENGFHEVGFFRGPNAQAEAESLCGALTRYGIECSISMSDTLCNACGETFWHEAANPLQRGGWGCPACSAVIE